MKTNIVDVFCIIDDFSKLFDEAIKKKTLEEADKKRRNRKFKMSDSEVMTILILFHLSRYRDLKAFYLQYITHSCRSEFPHLVSYNRFVELQSRVGFKLIAFLNMRPLQNKEVEGRGVLGIKGASEKGGSKE